MSLSDPQIMGADGPVLIDADGNCEVEDSLRVSTHDFQYIDLVLPHAANPGQLFARPKPSKCIIQLEDDVLDRVRSMDGSTQAVDTEGQHCACAVHAVFGAPSTRGKLLAPNARQLALSLLAEAPRKATHSLTVRRRRQLFVETFWEEFMLRHFRGDPTVESRLFA